MCSAGRLWCLLLVATPTKEINNMAILIAWGADKAGKRLLHQ